MRRKVKVVERGKSRRTCSPEQDFPKLIRSKTLFFEHKHYSDQQNIKIIIKEKFRKTHNVPHILLRFNFNFA